MGPVFGTEAKLFVFACLSLSAALTTNCRREGVYPFGAPCKGLLLTIDVPKKQVAAGEKIEITARLQNVGEEILRIVRFDAPPRHHFYVQVGEYGPRCAWPMKPLVWREDEVLVLEPGDTYEEETDWPLLHPGTLTLRGRYHASKAWNGQGFEDYWSGGRHFECREGDGAGEQARAEGTGIAGSAV